MAKRDRDWELRHPTKTIRFSEDELERLRPLMNRARRRNSLATPSDVLKELMGLTNDGLVTPAERRRLLMTTQPAFKVNAAGINSLDEAEEAENGRGIKDGTGKQ